MREAVQGPAGVRLRDDVTLRPIGPDEIRVKVTACGICGTDLLEGAGGGEESGFGHEVAGTVAEIGSSVSGLVVGQPIVLDSSSACGTCFNCKNAEQELCTNVTSFGHSGTPGFAEELISPAISAVPSPNLSPDVACLSEPLGVAIDMVRLADIKTTSNVLLLGPGPIGLMALALVKRMGARRIFLSAFSAEKARIEVARKFGADEVIDPSVTPLKDVDFGCNIDRVLVTTPPVTLADAMAVACKGGIISYIGIRWGEGAFCRFDANDFHFKKLQLRASFAAPALFTPLAVRYLEEGVVDGQALISHRFKLEQIAEAMKTARDTTQAVKVVVMP